MKNLRSYVEGRWHEATADFRPLVNPSTEEVIANLKRELEALKAYALQAEKPGLEELPSTVSHMDSWLGVMPNILRSFATEFD